MDICMYKVHLSCIPAFIQRSSPLSRPGPGVGETRSCRRAVAAGALRMRDAPGCLGSLHTCFISIVYILYVIYIYHIYIL